MKDHRKIMIGAALLLTACCIYVEYKDRPVRTGEELPYVPEGHMPAGGTSDYSDPDAPKKIHSKIITSFECTVSLKNAEGIDRDSLCCAHYTFAAASAGEKVECSFAADAERSSFSAGAEFLSAIQDIIDRYELASCNGIDRFTHGLPEDLGAALRVVYASGERIYASDNTDMFIPEGAVKELAALFWKEGR